MSIIKTTIKSCNKKYNKLSNLNKEDLLNDFKMFLKVHRPTMRNINKFGKDYNVSMSKVVYFYGGLCNMLKEIGYEKPRSNKYTKEEVSVKLKNIFNEYGFVSKELLEKLNGKPDYVNHKTITRIYGSFANMYKELFPDVYENNCFSFGELLIYKYLKSKNIEFIKEYRDHDLINKAKLRYDFYIPSKNTIIEFNGIQHYEYTKYFHKSVERYEYQKFKDKIKQKYAESLNIKYIIIKYSDIHKIPEILNKEL